MTTIDHGRLISELSELARFGRSEDGGITRPAFSVADIQARDWLRERMQEAGLETRVDPAGNLIGRTGPDGPAVVVGSHIDTVEHGGALDGALGVLAGLACARALVAEDLRLSRAVEVVAFADEEGRFYQHLGSLAMADRLKEMDLEALVDTAGMSFASAAADAGLDVAAITDAARPVEDVVAFLELHIEQGPVLESEGLVIGVVESICGLSRVRYTFNGEANHSGATPQHLRRDALLGAVEFIARAEQSLTPGPDAETRLTFGEIEASPGVDCVIPGAASLTCEVRHPDSQAIVSTVAAHRELATQIATGRGLEVSGREYARTEPVPMTPALFAAIRGACQDRGISYRRMTSGAGHDAQSFVGLADVGMVFVPSRAGRSHTPEEHTDPEQIAAGAAVLCDVLSALVAADVAATEAEAVSR